MSGVVRSLVYVGATRECVQNGAQLGRMRTALSKRVEYRVAYQELVMRISGERSIRTEVPEAELRVEEREEDNRVITRRTQRGKKQDFQKGTHTA